MEIILYTKEGKEVAKIMIAEPEGGKRPTFISWGQRMFIKHHSQYFEAFGAGVAKVYEHYKA